jgi:hypothetical protein
MEDHAEDEQDEYATDPGSNSSGIRMHSKLSPSHGLVLLTTGWAYSSGCPDASVVLLAS